MARPRTRRTYNLPPNLYEERHGKRRYYRFRDPQSGKRRHLGQDRKRAIQTAQRINREIDLERNERLDSIVGDFAAARERARRQSPSFAEFIKIYVTKVLPDARRHRGKAYSPDTLREKERHLRDAVGDIGELNVADITTRDIKMHLTRFDDRPRSHNQRRASLQKAFNSAIEQGYRESNPVTATATLQAQSHRARLTLEEFNLIHSEAPRWFKNVLNLALITGQRRSDLVGMRFDAIQDGYLPVRQEKGRRHNTGLVRIEITPELDTIINQCRDGVDSPFILHKQPARRSAKPSAKRSHPTQLMKEQLTRTFADIRDELGIRSELPTGERPTFHEIRALSGHLCSEAGWTTGEIADLLGHEDEKTTERYLSDHHQQERWHITPPATSHLKLV